MPHNSQSQPKPQPSWLTRLLETTNFYEFCTIENHTTKNNIIFCLTCRNGAICELCAEQDHQFHRTLRVFKASHLVSVRVDDMRKRIDDGGIQPFVINGKSIFFIHSRGKSLLPHTPKCVVCEGHLKAAPYEYCSIACKVEHGLQCHEDQYGIYNLDPLSIDGEEQGENSGESKPVVLSDGDSQKQGQAQRVASSSLKRKRKGIPRRSPFI